MHLPVVGHGAVDLVALQQADDKVRLLDGLLHGDGLGEEVDAGLDARRHGPVNILGVESILHDAAGAVAPQADPHHGELHAVGLGGLPVDGVVGAGPVLIGGHVDAEAGPVVVTGIDQAVRTVRVPHEISLGEAVPLHPGVDGDLLVAVCQILPCGLRGRVHVAGLDGRRLLRLLRPLGEVRDHGAAEVPYRAPDGHVLQGHRPGDAGGQNQIPRDGHVLEAGPLRRVDHHRALHVLGVGGAGLDQHLDHVVQDRHDLRPGDGVRGTEVPVGGIRDVAQGGHLRQIRLRVIRHLVRIQVIDRCALPRDVEGPCDHGHRLLAGDGVPGQGLPVVAQVNAGGVELQDGILPVVPAQIRERPGGRGALEFQEAVQNARKGAPGDGVVRPECAVLIAVDDAVLLTPFRDGGLRPVARRIGKGRPGRQYQRPHCHCQRQQRRKHPFFSHDPLPFLFFRHTVSQKSPTAVRRDAIIGLHIITAASPCQSPAGRKRALQIFPEGE